jgi:hypothetical protein
VLRSWISNSDTFNENDKQIKKLIQGRIVEGQHGEEKELSDSKIIAIQRKLISASSWEGECESKLSVVKCLASLLSVETGTKKRKI